MSCLGSVPGVRYWTVAEARAYLPRLRELVAQVKELAMVVERAGSNGHGPQPDDLRDALDELAAGDIILRDPASGLIDFHAKGADGVVYLLCWRQGEDELEWWHLPEEGFAGRKRLPRDPE
jgi:hypothetical protein